MDTNTIQRSHHHQANMFSLIKYAPRVYHLQFTKRFDLCATFMRYQEFYESANPRFVNSSFTLAEFERWYTYNTGGDEFTYHSDWSGFNMPLNIIKCVHDQGIADPNMYDSLMWGIYKMIDSVEQNCYIIGTSKECDIIDHELTHAMYYINEQYKLDVDNVIKYAVVWYQSLYEKLCSTLSNEGYAPHVFWDEINAYLTEQDVYQPIGELSAEDGYCELRDRLINVRKKYFEDKN